MILLPTTEAQTITFIPTRDVGGMSGQIRLTRKGTGNEVIVPVDFVNEREFTTATTVIGVVEGFSYTVRVDLIVEDENIEIYRDSAFTTVQDAEEYQTITSAIEHPTDNTFNLPNDG